MCTGVYTLHGYLKSGQCKSSAVSEYVLESVLEVPMCWSSCTRIQYWVFKGMISIVFLLLSFQPHLTKCFGNIAALDIKQVPRQPLSVKTMSSAEGEVISMPK